MKTLILLFSFTFCVGVYGQDTTRYEVNQLKGTKADIHAKAKSIIQQGIKNPTQDIITVDDSKAGKLVCFNGFECHTDDVMKTITVRYKMTIDSKDSKYKITISDFSYPKGFSGISWKFFDLKVSILMGQFVEAMNSPVSEW